MHSYDLVVGVLAHRAIATIAAMGRDAGTAPLHEEAWVTAGRLVRDHPELGPRTRAARLVVASTVGVYIRYFLPPAAWALAGAEVDIDGGRLDLVWESDAGITVYDELKLAGSSGRFRGPGPTDRQVRHYLAHGTATHGDDFGGVRLVLLGAPRHSMLVGPGDRLRPLVDTGLWFAQADGVAA